MELKKRNWIKPEVIGIASASAAQNGSGTLKTSGSVEDTSGYAIGPTYS